MVFTLIILLIPVNPLRVKGRRDDMDEKVEEVEMV